MALCRHWSRRCAFKRYTSTKAMNAQEVADGALRNAELPKIKAMEKDLHALESDLFARKQDLNTIKKKWGLKSETFGSAISIPAARQALAEELRQNIRSLQSRHSGDPSFVQPAMPGAILSAVADSQESSPLKAATSNSQPGRFGLALTLGGGAALALAVYVLNQQRVEPQKDSSIQQHQSRPSDSAPSTKAAIVPLNKSEGKTKGHDASVGDSQTQGKSAEKSKLAPNKQADAIERNDAEVKTADSSSAGKSSTATELAVDPKIVAAVSLVVIGLGFWWIWREPPQGPLLPLDSNTHRVDALDSMPDVAPVQAVASGQAESFLRARQAGEVIFENAPKEGQVWDMSASVRGIKGGVQEKINQFQR